MSSLLYSVPIILAELRKDSWGCVNGLLSGKKVDLESRFTIVIQITLSVEQQLSSKI